MHPHWNSDCLLEDFSGKNNENIVNTTLKHLDDVIFRVLDFRIREFLHKIFVPTVTVCENEGVSDNTGKSVIQLLVRYGCIKSEKIKIPDACYMVESSRFKML